jgi:hypothetical protein
MQRLAARGGVRLLENPMSLPAIPETIRGVQQA